jgi:hypothetical protein
MEEIKPNGHTNACSNPKKTGVYPENAIYLKQ